MFHCGESCGGGDGGGGSGSGNGMVHIICLSRFLTYVKLCDFSFHSFFQYITELYRKKIINQMKSSR